MIFLQKRKTSENLKLSSIFLCSALFFAFFSFFGVYEYEIYSLYWFILFFVYELIFFLGLKSGKFFRKKEDDELEYDSDSSYSFELSDNGATILLIACIISILCFVYFVFLYRSVIGSFAFGTYGSYTASSFEEGRTALEKLTLFLMQMGGEAAFLICAIDKSDKHKVLKALTHVTLFLPGLRYLLMGSRFSIAVEFLLLFFVKWPLLRAKLKFSIKARRERRIIILAAVVLGIVFLYLFASRAIYYTAVERKSFNVGDMQMKTFWRELYDDTNGRIDPICTASDYLGEAPYVFSYFCKNKMPDQIYWGQFSFRSIMQIFNNLFHIGNGFSQISGEVAGGQYAGMSWILIADFGTIGSFIFAFLFGHVFALIEEHRKRIRTCAVILPAIKVICFFAPIYYFYVGRIDYTILFCLILSPICLKNPSIVDNDF